MSFQKLAMWFRKRDVNNVEKNGFRHSQCVVSKRHVRICGVKTNECGVETAFAAFVMWI